MGSASKKLVRAEMQLHDDCNQSRKRGFRTPAYALVFASRSYTGNTGPTHVAVRDLERQICRDLSAKRANFPQRPDEMNGVADRSRE